jgi:phosphatidylglycerophosphate synthase
MKPTYLLFDESDLQLWRLTPGERLRRQFARRGLVECHGLEELSAERTLILLSGAHIFDARVLDALVNSPGVLLCETSEHQNPPVVAAHLTAACGVSALALMRSEDASIESLGLSSELRDVRLERPESLTPAFDKRRRRASSPTVYRVLKANRRNLENRLFNLSYKGVTDLVTRFVWPRPARAVTRFCTNIGLSPNQVTCFGILMTVLAGIFFANGFFGWGLLCGWAMTFLDTVDGKLARVTVTSTRIGHLLDHGLDIVHPPLWYLAWGLGLVAFDPLSGISLATGITLMFLGYVLGRVAEVAYKTLINRSGLYVWRPFDSFFRLVTARRNPNLIFLTAGLLLGRPDLGFEALVWWTAATTVVLAVRVLQAFAGKRRGACPRSWLLDIDVETDRSLAASWFAPRSIPRNGTRDDR